MKNRFIYFTALVAMMTSTFAQSDTNKTANDYYQQGMVAYQDGNYQLFLDNFIEARKIRPNNPSIAYNLACGYALTGRDEKSLDVLEKLVNRGIDFGIEQDTDFETLRNNDRFDKICAKLQEFRKTINNSKIAFSIPEKDLIPEGIAYDPINNQIFLSSIYKRKIVSINNQGIARNFTEENQDSIWATLGMEVDPINRVLWVCSSSSPKMHNFNAKDSGRAYVHKYDLSGDFIKKYLPPDNNYHEFNDLTISKNGDIYITDSHTGEIFLINHQSDSLELFIPEGEFIGSNGIALSEDNDRLFVAAFSEGIYVVNLADTTFRLLTLPEKYTTYGIDGLYYYKHSLIAVQNGIRPNRIVRFFLNDTNDGILKADIIEMNNNLFNEPTTGTIAGNIFYYIANSQISSFDNQNEIWPSDRLEDVTILKASLE